MFPVLVAQGDYYWTGGTSSNPTDVSNWENGIAPTIVNGVVADYLTIRTGAYYPIFTFAVIIGDAVNSISGSITVNAGASIKFEDDLYVESPLLGLLLIKSSATGEGKIICDDPYGSLPYATIELQLLGSSSRFHYFVPPVSTMSLWSSLPSALTQTRTALSIGFSFLGNLVRFTESRAVATKEAGWQWFDGYNSTTAFKSIVSSLGYNIYFSSPTKMTFKGTLNCEEKTFNLSYTAINAGAGWNLIGNPYPCNYNLSGISALMTDNDNINNYVYYNKDGGYVYYNPKDGTGSSVCTCIIPPMQGFFVHALSSGKSVTLPITSKTFDAAQTRTKGTGYSSKTTTVQKIKLVLNSPSQSDETMVGIFDDATVDFNQNHDAVKMFGTNPSPYIYSEINGADYFMKAIPKPSSVPVIVPLKVVLNESGAHSIRITEFENLDSYSIKLKHGDMEVPLNIGTNYEFNSNSGTYTDYSLVFSSIVTVVESPNSKFLKTWYHDNYLYINYPDEIQTGNSSLSIYDFNGKKIYGNNNIEVTPGETKQIQLNIHNGLYVVDLVLGLKHYKSKIVVF